MGSMYSDIEAWSEEQVAELAQAQGWTRRPSAAALGMLLRIAQRTGLDPLARQLYLQERGGRGTVMTSIDGMRLVGHRAARALDGALSQGQPEWCGTDGAWRDVWLDSTPPAAARVSVSLVSPALPQPAVTTAVAHMSEYRPRHGGGLWGQMPALMLAKCAEALALRRAFPAELSGLYTSDEMAQAQDRGSRAPDMGMTASQMRMALADADVAEVRRVISEVGGEGASSRTLSPEQRAEVVQRIRGGSDDSGAS